MRDHTKKVAKVGFAWLAIFSAVVLFFPLAYRAIPWQLQDNKPFTCAYVVVSVCWVVAVALVAIQSTVDADAKSWREYYDSLTEWGDEGDDEDDDDTSPDDTEVLKHEPIDEQTNESSQSPTHPPINQDSGFVRADDIKQSPYQSGIQIFRVPGGTSKPGM